MPRLLRSLAWIIVLLVGQWAQLALAAPGKPDIGLSVADAWHHQAEQAKEGPAPPRLQLSSAPTDEPFCDVATARLPASFPAAAFGPTGTMRQAAGIAVGKGFDSCGPPLVQPA